MGCLRKDANGCIAMQNVTVVSDAPPTIVAQQHSASLARQLLLI
jgi:hypothetical protein